AGAAAAFTVDLLIYPLDTIKTRYQSQDYLQTFKSSSSSGSASGAAAGITKPSRTAAFRGLYQGVGSVIVATLPAAGIFFTTYEAAKPLYATLLNRLPLLPEGTQLPTPVVHSLASGTAELASCLVLTPAEVIKQNAQMIRAAPPSGSPSSAAGRDNGGNGASALKSRWEKSTSVQALRIMSQNRGASGVAHRLLTGYTALAARNLPFTALQFPVFEAVRSRVWTGPNGTGAGAKEVAKGLLETGCVNGFAAAVSGAIAAVVTTPTDVVKTRMMLLAGDEDAQSKTGSWHMARLVYQERGIQGLFRGAVLRAVWTAVGSGLYLGTYEVAKVYLKGAEEVGGGDGDDGEGRAL
ncbi:mitochondrial carrier domain-containing protein, partial [Coniella lustricola]